MKELYLGRLGGFKMFELDKETQQMMGTKCKYFATDGKTGYFHNNKKNLCAVFQVVHGKQIP